MKIWCILTEEETQYPLISLTSPTELKSSSPFAFCQTLRCAKICFLSKFVFFPNLGQPKLIFCQVQQSLDKFRQVQQRFVKHYMKCLGMGFLEVYHIYGSKTLNHHPCSDPNIWPLLYWSRGGKRPGGQELIRNICGS